MKTLVRPVLLGAVLLVLGSIGFTACGGEEPAPETARPQAAAEPRQSFPTPRPTIAPTNTPEPTPVPPPTNTPEPTAVPEPTSTPEAMTAPTPQVATTEAAGSGDDVEDRVRAYARECGELTAALSSNPMAMADTEAGATWGETAAALEVQLETYSQLEPPAEVEEYHNARLATLEAFLDHARSRPAEASMLADMEQLMTTVMPQIMVIGMDQSKTEEQKQQEIEQLLEEPLMDLLGEDFPAAARAEQEARDALTESLRNILDQEGCSSPDEEEFSFP